MAFISDITKSMLNGVLHTVRPVECLEGASWAGESLEGDPFDDMDEFLPDDYVDFQPVHFAVGAAIPDLVAEQVESFCDSSVSEPDDKELSQAIVSSEVLTLLTSVAFTGRSLAIAGQNGQAVDDRFVTLYEESNIVLPNVLADYIESVGNTSSSRLAVPDFHYVSEPCSGLDTFPGVLEIPGFYHGGDSSYHHYADYPSVGVALQRLIYGFVHRKSGRNIRSRRWRILGSNAYPTKYCLGYGDFSDLSALDPLLRRLIDQKCTFQSIAGFISVVSRLLAQYYPYATRNVVKISCGSDIQLGCNQFDQPWLKLSPGERELVRRYGFHDYRHDPKACRPFILESEFVKLNRHFLYSYDGGYLLRLAYRNG